MQFFRVVFQIPFLNGNMGEMLCIFFRRVFCFSSQPRFRGCPILQQTKSYVQSQHTKSYEPSQQTKSYERPQHTNSYEQSQQTKSYEQLNPGFRRGPKLHFDVLAKYHSEHQCNFGRACLLKKIFIIIVMMKIIFLSKRGGPKLHFDAFWPNAIPKIQCNFGRAWHA